MVQCGVLWCSAVCRSAMWCAVVQCPVLRCNAVCCSAVWHSSMQCAAVQYSSMQCAAVQYSSMQCAVAWQAPRLQRACHRAGFLITIALGFLLNTPFSAFPKYSFQTQ